MSGTHTSCERKERRSQIDTIISLALERYHPFGYFFSLFCNFVGSLSSSFFFFLFFFFYVYCQINETKMEFDLRLVVYLMTFRRIQCYVNIEEIEY